MKLFFFAFFVDFNNNNLMNTTFDKSKIEGFRLKKSNLNSIDRI